MKGLDWEAPVQGLHRPPSCSSLCCVTPHTRPEKQPGSPQTGQQTQAATQLLAWTSGKLCWREPEEKPNLHTPRSRGACSLQSLTARTARPLHFDTAAPGPQPVSWATHLPARSLGCGHTLPNVQVPHTLEGP